MNYFLIGSLMIMMGLSTSMEAKEINESKFHLTKEKAAPRVVEVNSLSSIPIKKAIRNSFAYKLRKVTIDKNLGVRKPFTNWNLC